MKLQNLIIIFLAVALPVILVLAIYVELQVDTATLKAQYNDYLVNAAHETIVAYQLNTLNDKYANNTDPRLRNITAALNIFASNLSASFNSTGASRSIIMTHIPALLFTMYDGYYIYNPAEYSWDKWDGDNLSWGSGNKLVHELKPYVHYAKEYNDGNKKVIINYSLDNYISVYYYNNGTYETRAGFLEVAPDVLSAEDIQENKYYKEATEFTEWYNNNIADIIQKSIKAEANTSEDARYNRKMKIDKDNLALPEEASGFNDEKNEVIKGTITNNLKQVLHVYGKEMPELNGNDWNTIMNNICFVAFMQDIPVGTTTYNNYTIAISTENKEKADANSIFYANYNEGTGKYEGEYHRIWCDKLDIRDQSVVGINKADLENNEIYNKIPACYYCAIRASDSSLEAVEEQYKKTPIGYNKEYREKLYYISLAQEKYKLSRVLDFVNGTHLLPQ